MHSSHGGRMNHATDAVADGVPPAYDIAIGATMISYLDDLPSGRDLPHVLNAVIEIPKGSSNKYEYDKELNVFRLDRTLYSPVHYPGAYGFIPRTLSEDGDPLDVVVIVEHDTFPGCLIEVRPVGVLVMRDDAGLDHKILAVPTSDPRLREVHGLQHLAKHYLSEIDYFFNIYKELEGKKSDTYGWEDRLTAHQVITESIRTMSAAMLYGLMRAEWQARSR
jgi:inorganic pyrophosphatase